MTNYIIVPHRGDFGVFVSGNTYIVNINTKQYNFFLEFVKAGLGETIKDFIELYNKDFNFRVTVDTMNDVIRPISSITKEQDFNSNNFTLKDVRDIITRINTRLENLCRSWDSYTRHMECGEIKELKRSCIDDEIIRYILNQYLKGYSSTEKEEEEPPQLETFEVGKYYQHTTGHAFYVILSTNSIPDYSVQEHLIAVDLNGNYIAIGIGKDYCMNYREITKEEWDNLCALQSMQRG